MKPPKRKWIEEIGIDKTKTLRDAGTEKNGRSGPGREHIPIRRLKRQKYMKKKKKVIFQLHIPEIWHVSLVKTPWNTLYQNLYDVKISERCQQKLMFVKLDQEKINYYYFS